VQTKNNNGNSGKLKTIMGTLKTKNNNGNSGILKTIMGTVAN